MLRNETKEAPGDPCSQQPSETASCGAMEAVELRRTEFPAFPYPPYTIQQQFMQELYDTVQKGQIGLFESPTGTGKTLGVICSVLQWLVDTKEAVKEQERQKELQRQQAAQQLDEASEGAEQSGCAVHGNGVLKLTSWDPGAGDALPSWLVNYQAPPSPQPSAAQGKPKQPPKATTQAPSSTAPPTTTAAAAAAGLDPQLTEFLIDDAASPCGAKRSRTTAGALSSSSDASSDEAPTAVEAAARSPSAPPAPHRPAPQVIFCSRTHSQLSQFVSELHRTCFAGQLSLVAVASRKALCINPKVLRLQHLSQINEACLDLQGRKGSTSRKAPTLPPTQPATTQPAAGGSSHSSHSGGAQQLAAGGPRRRGGGGSKGQAQGGCPYLRPAGGEGAWEVFREGVLAQPMDVEELGRLGQQQQLCPYYGSRHAVPSADVVLAPYSAVLQREARGSLGIRLEGAVVVFDEGHNLLDAVNASHSAAITGAQLLSCRAAVQGYLQRFSALLGPHTAQQLQLVLRVVGALLRGLQGPAAIQGAGGGGGSGGPDSSSSSSRLLGRVCRVNDVLLDLQLDNVNLFPLLSWMRERKMVFKMAGYASLAASTEGQVQLQPPSSSRAAGAGVTSSNRTGDAPRASPAPPHHHHQQPQQQQQGHPTSSVTAALHALLSFVAALTNRDADGRIIIEPAAAAPPPTTKGPQQHRPASGGSRAAAAAAAAGGDGGVAPLGEEDLPTNAADDLDSLPTTSAGAAAAGQQLAGGAGGGGSAQPPRSGRYRFVLLNAARHFAEVLSAARSVVLVSGTLAPISSLQAQLLPGVPPPRLRHFECGHVIAREQLLALSIGRGPSGQLLDLRHSSRGGQEVMDAAGAVLLNLAGVVPGGLVVFVGSFAYLEQLWARWGASGLLGRLEKRKAVFREPRTAGEVEAVLQQYSCAIRGSSSSSEGAEQPPAATFNTPPGSHPAAGGGGVGSAAGPTAKATTAGAAAAAIPAAGGAAAAAAAGPLQVAAGAEQSPGAGGSTGRDVAGGAGTDQRLPGPGSGVGGAGGGGALLLCVVGGKLSEGINFGDDLGRAVVVLGMPYPNPADPELQERMNYLDAAAAATAAAARSVPPPLPPPPAQGPPTAAAAAAAAAAAQATAATPGCTAHKAAAPPPAAAAAAAAGPPVALTGREYYEDLCFKAVNQCIGRVIRHKGDYAVVLLVDARWVPRHSAAAAAAASTTPHALHHHPSGPNSTTGRPADTNKHSSSDITTTTTQTSISSQQVVGQAGGSRGGAGGGGCPPALSPALSTGPLRKLPGWMLRSYVEGSGEFGEAYRRVAAFFKAQRQQQQQQQ